MQRPFQMPGLQRSIHESTSDIGLICQQDGRYIDNRLIKSYDCVPDEPHDIGLFLDTCDLYKDTQNARDSCLNVCSGRGWTRCTCSALNHNSQMIYKNNNQNLCRPLDYINFSKTTGVRITGLKSAKDENKCTMQFWMFAYAYGPKTFGGITFKWTGHNIIKVMKTTSVDYEYTFYCSVDFDDPTNGLSQNIKINQWIFLSCAVDYDKLQKIYINSNTQDNKVYYAEDDVTGSITVESSELYIEDNTVYDDWGYLFFRQIRLWNDAFFNAEFLSRIYIETPSKFINLLHSWEPVYKGILGDGYETTNFKVEDIATNQKNFEVKYLANYQSKNGMNIIDENYYSILTMCSEDGYYFDVTLKKCLQFLDLSKMNDFTFKELHSSYNGNYGMAF
jgi:hypothetical protein